jgi:hypothetical protein
MRTRSGSLYLGGGREHAPVTGQKRKRSPAAGAAGECCAARVKRQAGGPDFLDGIPDDLVLTILSKVAATASSPADLLSVHLTYAAAPAPFIPSRTPLYLLPQVATAPFSSRVPSEHLGCGGWSAITEGAKDWD